MKITRMKIIYILLFILPSFVSFAQSTSEIEPLTIGEHVTFHSEILDQDRELNIYLPHGYSEDSAKLYPVIYLFDGSIYEDFLHVAGIVQFGSYPWINMLEESIVVGISNIDRKHDFTFPTEKEEYKEINPVAGGSAKFMEFIESELKPLVESSYKVSDESTVIGQSLGGLLATEILLKKPDLFNNYVIVSPSLWWDEESLFDVDFPEFSDSKKIYVGVGKEGKIMQKDARKLYKWIKSEKNDSTKLAFNFFPENDHGDVLHVAVYDAFIQLFGSEAKE